MPTVHLLIKGKVQGVFYRASAKEVAGRLGVTGWIKNTNDNKVEAKITGTGLQVKEFVTWCHHGPKNAQVTEIIETPCSEETFAGFTVER